MKYQQCLDTIDQDLAKNRQMLVDTANKNKAAEEARLAQDRQNMASPQSRLFYCRVHMQEVIEAEQERSRLLPARIRAYKDPNLTNAERSARIATYNAAEQKLSDLIPSQYRSGMELIPTAVQKFSTCKLEDFIEPASTD